MRNCGKKKGCLAILSRILGFHMIVLVSLTVSLRGLSCSHNSSHGGCLYRYGSSMCFRVSEVLIQWNLANPNSPVPTSRKACSNW